MQLSNIYMLHLILPALNIHPCSQSDWNIEQRISNDWWNSILNSVGILIISVNECTCASNKLSVWPWCVIRGTFSVVLGSNFKEWGDLKETNMLVVKSAVDCLAWLWHLICECTDGVWKLYSQGGCDRNCTHSREYIHWCMWLLKVALNHYGIR